mmetsp:Transcript_4402/g.12173  ORF Transcript_4402/g.12173 Transcript_4402/m.12173 type:complete len:226 (-) Transcript_4402:881-1558(-)
MRSVVICSCLGICSNKVLGEECLRPTSKMAATKSRCKSSGHVNRLDHRPSLFLLLLLLLGVLFSPVASDPLVDTLALERRRDFLVDRDAAAAAMTLSPESAAAAAAFKSRKLRLRRDRPPAPPLGLLLVGLDLLLEATDSGGGGGGGYDPGAAAGSMAKALGGTGGIGMLETMDAAAALLQAAAGGAPVIAQGVAATAFSASAIAAVVALLSAAAPAVTLPVMLS